MPAIDELDQNTTQYCGKGRPAKQWSKSREIAAWQMHISGRYTQSDIAREIGMTQSGVSRVLQRVGQSISEALKEDTMHIVASAHARYETILVDCLNAWDQSKSPTKRVRQRQQATDREGAVMADNVLIEVFSDARESTGNVFYLDRAMSALKAMTDLVGVSTPVKLARPDAANGNSAEHAQIRELLKATLLAKLDNQFAAIEATGEYGTPAK